jgi:hypothetical protein
MVKMSAMCWWNEDDRVKQTRGGKPIFLLICPPKILALELNPSFRR